MFFFRQKPNKKRRTRDQRRRRWAFYLSAWLHGSLVSAGVYCRIMGIEIPVIDKLTGHQRQVVHVDTWTAHLDPDPFLDPVEAADQQVRRMIVASDADPQRDAAAEKVVRSVDLQSPPPADNPNTETVGLGDFVRSRVDRAVEEAGKLKPDEKLARLDDLSKQLNSVSSPEAVGELTNKLQTFLGGEKRAEKPAEKPVAGPFDYNTAQLHDVRREEKPNGRFKYTATLIDAAGRTMETDMDEAEGESAYKTMQLIKSNPLLEKIYRGVVMGMIDKMLKPAEPPAAKPVP